jgi:hypothetical protein
VATAAFQKDGKKGPYFVARTIGFTAKNFLFEKAIGIGN